MILGLRWRDVDMSHGHIEAAGIEREELRVRTKTSRWIVFHDLRATGAVCGHAVPAIARSAARRTCGVD